jgi:hypothetical protein
MFSRRSFPGREYVTRAGSGRARYPAFKRVLRIYHGEFPKRKGCKAYTPRAFSQNQYVRLAKFQNRIYQCSYDFKARKTLVNYLYLYPSAIGNLLITPTDSDTIARTQRFPNFDITSSRRKEHNWVEPEHAN